MTITINTAQFKSIATGSPFCVLVAFTGSDKKYDKEDEQW
jgi:hypothetical protein